MNVSRKRHLDHVSEPVSAGQTGSSRLAVRYTRAVSTDVETSSDLLEPCPPVVADGDLTRVNPARFRHFDHGPETITEDPVPLSVALSPYTAKTDVRRAAKAVER